MDLPKRALRKNPLLELTPPASQGKKKKMAKTIMDIGIV